MLSDGSSLTLLSFNSIKVRLKHDALVRGWLKLPTFNSIKVRLKHHHKLHRIAD